MSSCLDFYSDNTIISNIIVMEKLKIGQNHLCGLALLNSHRGIEISIIDII